jgi:hypothetical protein
MHEITKSLCASAVQYIETAESQSTQRAVSLILRLQIATSRLTRGKAYLFASWVWLFTEFFQFVKYDSKVLIV